MFALSKAAVAFGAVLVVLALCGEARSQALRSLDMGAVTARLGERFEEFRKFGLGVDELEAEYRKVGFEFSSLDEPRVTTLLSNQTAQETVANVMTLFSDIATQNFGSSSPFATPPTTDCCTIGQSDSQACCHSCNTVSEPVDSTLVDNIARAFRDASLDGVELQFGLTSGALLNYPVQYQTNCTALNARLQPWYIDTVRTKPREVVLLLDLTLHTIPITIDITGLQPLRQAAQVVLSSLTSQDKVGVVAVGADVTTAEVNSEGVVSTCPENKETLRREISGIRATDGPGSYTNGFNSALGLFTNDPTTDKLLLFFTVGYTLYDNIDFNTYTASNDAVISVYRTIPQAEDPSGDNLLQKLVLQPGGNGTVVTLDSPMDVGNYYSVFPASTSSNIVVSHQLNLQGVDSISISRVIYNDSTLVGVAHAVLPWKQVFGHITVQLTKRTSSYFFVVGKEGRVLFHPLFPSDSQSEVHIDRLELQGNVSTALEMLQSNPSYSYQTDNIIFIPASHLEKRRYIRRQIPTTYYWRDLAISGVEMYVCLVLADEDASTVGLPTMDPQDLYASMPSRRPIYHNVAESVSDDSVCNYFCTRSTSDRVSFQLTGQNVPPESYDSSLVQDYIDGVGPRPEWVGLNVPGEVAVSSAVSAAWVDQDQGIEDYIIRRHLATPSGVYLTFPPVHLSRNFLPMNTAWFSLSTPHRSILTLTPPRNDPLQEAGAILSLGYTLRAPGSEEDMDLSDGGQVLSVLAADVALDTLRAMLSGATSLCDDNSYSCFIVDDRGFLIYHDSFLGGLASDDPVFMTEVEENRGIFVKLLEAYLIVKRQCAERFTQGVKSRLFYTLDLSNPDRSASSFSDSCSQFTLRRIPNTNAFLGVQQRATGCGGVCFNAKQCLSSCGQTSLFGCEEPCFCDEDCLDDTGFPSCPQVTEESDNLGKVGAALQTSHPFCFNQLCQCRNSLKSCSGVRGCKWCEANSTCVPLSECCNRDRNGGCCDPGREEFSSLPSCFVAQCADQTFIPTVTACPTLDTSSDDGDDGDDTAVYAGVAGGFVGLLLIILLVVFIVWYQCCRGDTDEDASKGSAFDFTKGRVEAANPAPTSPKEKVEMENAIKGDVGDMKTEESTII